MLKNQFIIFLLVRYAWEIDSFAVKWNVQKAWLVDRNWLEAEFWKYL